MRRVDRVVDVGRVRQDHLAIGQDLRQSELIGIALDAELEHGVAYDLGRPLVVREHDGLVEDDALGLDVVALHCHLDDIEVRRALVRVTGTGQATGGTVRIVQASTAVVATTRAERDVQRGQGRRGRRGRHLRGRGSPVE